MPLFYGMSLLKTTSVSEDGPAVFNVSQYFVPAYMLTALRVARYWNKNDNCAVVVGATQADGVKLRIVRQIVSDMPILIPGIGAQGGDVEKTITNGCGRKDVGMIINASRSIIFASSGEDFGDAARRESIKLNETIKQYL